MIDVWSIIGAVGLVFLLWLAPNPKRWRVCVIAVDGAHYYGEWRATKADALTDMTTMFEKMAQYESRDIFVALGDDGYVRADQIRAVDVRSW